MNILSWIILGLIAGAIAKLIMPTNNSPRGCLGTIILGIVGAMLGGYLGSRFLGTGNVNDWSWESLGLSVGGAVLVLWISSFFSRRR